MFAFLAELHRLDRPGRVVVTPHYDPDFKEPALLDTGAAIGARGRRELPPIRIPCQVEPTTFEALEMFAAGASPRSQVQLVFHFASLERAGLVDVATGDALVRVGDRLGALYDIGGALVQRVRTPPGLYVTEARPIGFGLFMPRPRRNLLLVTLDERDAAAPRGSS
ncbi:MAG: hypothetical protein ACHREM_26765 [Polyangiales bacterium]